MEDSLHHGLVGLFLDWREVLLSILLGILGGMAKCARQFMDGSIPLTGLKGVTYARKGGRLFLAGFSGFSFYLLTADWVTGAHWKALSILLSGYVGSEAVDFLIDTGKATIVRWAGTAQAPKDPNNAHDVGDKEGL